MSENEAVDPLPPPIPGVSRRQQRWATRTTTTSSTATGAPLVGLSASTAIMNENNFNNSHSNINNPSAAAESSGGLRAGGKTKKKSGKSGKDKSSSSTGGKKEAEEEKKKRGKLEAEENEKNQKSALEERRKHDLDEQEFILAGDTVDDVVVYNKAPEWATKLADLTLTHMPMLNRDALFVSQGILDELNRDVLAAQLLHQEALNLLPSDMELKPPDFEERKRACLPPWVDEQLAQEHEKVLSGKTLLEDQERLFHKMIHGSLPPTTTANEAGSVAQQDQQQQQLQQPRMSVPPAAQTERLLANLTAARDAFAAQLQSQQQQIGLIGHHGEDGTEHSSLPSAAEITRHAALHRAIIEDQFPCHSSSPEGPYPAIANAGGLALRNFRNVPKVHAEFVVDTMQDNKADDSVLMDAGSARTLIRDAELIYGSNGINQFSVSHHRPADNKSNTNKRGQMVTQHPHNGGVFVAAAAAAVVADGKRIISVNLGSMRIRDHPICTREHYYAHHLLDAYSQYKMLCSNLLTGLKSRRHYQIIVEQLERSLMRRQRLNAIGGNSSASTRTPPRRSGASATSSPSPSSSASVEEQQLADQLYAAKTKLGMAVEMETHTLTTMWTSWKALQESWRTDFAAQLGRDTAEQNQNQIFVDENGNQLPQEVQAELVRTQTLNRIHQQQQQQSGGAARRCRLTFSLIKRDDPEQTHFVDAPNVNILDYVPNVVVDDPISVAQALQNAKRLREETEKANRKNNNNNKNNQTASSLNNNLSESKISTDSVFVLKLFIKTSEVAGFILVGVTAPKTLDSVLGVSFNETFELHVAKEPQTMLIHACLVPSGKVIAQVPIPPSLTHAAHELQFSTGERFTSATDSMPHEVGGVIIASTTWTTDSGMTVESIERLFLNGDADPMDPRNAPLVAALRRHYQLRAAVAATSLRNKPVISLLGRGGGSSAGESGKDGRLTTESLLQVPDPLQDRRLQLLQLRWKLTSGNFDPEKVDCYERRICNEKIPATAEATEFLERQLRTVVEFEETEFRETQGAVEAGGADPKMAGKAWLMKLREKKTNNKPPPLTDGQKLAKLINLPSIPTPGVVIDKIKAWFVPHSGFNPPREIREDAIEKVDRAKITEKWGASTISCSVMKASNLPTREDGTPIKAFCELRFIDKAVCTRSQTGSFASWFETLSVPFEPDDFEDDTLNFIDDDIVLSIYDEMRIALPNTATSNPNSQVTHFRVERRFLGAVKVPFYTLYSAKSVSIEATFRIFQPRSAMGYMLNPIAMPTINLFISLNPPLRKVAPPPPSLQKMQQQLIESPSSPALKELNRAALNWTMQVQSAVQAASALAPKAAQRELLPFAPTSSRDLQLICRFLRDKGINPPESITTIPEAIRFVSLFEFEVDIITSGDGEDQWSTLTEFLQIGCGDYEELAIFLVMLLRAISPDTPTFMITGMGDVYPQAVYVLMFWQGNWKLIDPRTGDLYDTNSTFSGLSEVSLIISHNQIWANIQPSGMPYRMMWDIDDLRNWMPMFDAEHRQLMTTIDSLQPAEIAWIPPASRQECSDFEDVVRRQIKEFIRVLRNDRNAVFHERIAVRMRDVLICMEDERRINANIPHPVVGESLSKALSEFGMEYSSIGSPVNKSVRKSEENSLVSQLGPLKDAIRETAVHEVGAQGATFAVAVHVRPYPHGIFSVWVYVVGLVQRM